MGRGNFIFSWFLPSPPSSQTLLPRIILTEHIYRRHGVSKLEICSGVSVIMTRTCCLLIMQFHFPIVVWFTVRYTIGNRYTEPFARAPSQYDKQSEDESLINWIFIFTLCHRSSPWVRSQCYSPPPIITARARDRVEHLHQAGVRALH